MRWVDVDTLAALAAHELGHLAHERWRVAEGLGGLAAGTGPLWRLYEEGFAMRCEHVVMGRESWHEQTGQHGWREWCAGHTGRLARAFLSRVEEGREVSDFFGDWYEIEGFKQCGYYLGHEALKSLEGAADLRAIATLARVDVERDLTRALEILAASR